MATADNKVAVIFSEAMDASTITNIANYQYVDNAATAVTRNLPSGTTFTAGADNKSVEITLPSSYTVLGAAATQYSVMKLNVSNVKDTAGNTLKNVSTGLKDIELASASTAKPKYVEKTFKLTADSTKVVAKFEMDQAITDLKIGDFIMVRMHYNLLMLQLWQILKKLETPQNLQQLQHQHLQMFME